MRKAVLAATMVLFANGTNAQTTNPSIYQHGNGGNETKLLHPNEYRGTANSAQMNRCEFFGKFAEDANQRHQNGEASSSILGTVLDFEIDNGGPSRESYILREIALFATSPIKPKKSHLLTVFLKCVEEDW